MEELFYLHKRPGQKHIVGIQPEKPLTLCLCETLVQSIALTRIPFPKPLNIQPLRNFRLFRAFRAFAAAWGTPSGLALLGFLDFVSLSGFGRHGYGGQGGGDAANPPFPTPARGWEDGSLIQLTRHPKGTTKTPSVRR